MMPLFILTRRDGYAARQFASGSLGVMLGDGAFRIGPYGTIGWSALGGGLAATIEGNWGGLEVRAAYQHLGDHGVQGVVMYQLPQPKGKHAAEPPSDTAGGA
jgi:hypothetical protein